MPSMRSAIERRFFLDCTPEELRISESTDRKWWSVLDQVDKDMDAFVASESLGCEESDWDWDELDSDLTDVETVG